MCRSPASCTKSCALIWHFTITPWPNCIQLDWIQLTGKCSTVEKFFLDQGIITAVRWLNSSSVMETLYNIGHCCYLHGVHWTFQCAPIKFSGVVLDLCNVWMLVSCSIWMCCWAYNLNLIPWIAWTYICTKHQQCSTECPLEHISPAA